MDSKKYPTLGISSDSLVCTEKDHNGSPFEFVCKKEDCKQRLVCAQCLLTNHSEHFPWMGVLEDFFNESLLKKSEEKAASLKDFVSKSESLESKFLEKLMKEKESVLKELNELRENILKKFTDIEKRVEEETENYKKNFMKDIAGIINLVDNNTDSYPDTINDLDTLLKYLNQNISKDDDLRDKKAKIFIERIEDYISAASLIQLDSQVFKNFASAMSKNICFNVEFELFDLQKKSLAHPISNQDISTLNCRRILQTNHKKAIFKVLFLDLESKILTCSDDHTIHIYEFKTGNQLGTLSGHSERVWSILRLQSGKLASCSADKTIKIWDLDKKTCEKTLEGHMAFVTCLVELPHGQLMSGSHDKTIKIWDINTEAGPFCKKTVKPSGGNIMSLVFLSPELLACAIDSSIQVLSYPDFILKHTLAGHTALVRDICFLHDKKILISSSDDKTIRLWNTENSKILKTLSGHSQTVTRIMLFKAEIFASSSDDGSIKLWEIDSGNCLKTLTGHEGWVINLNVLQNGCLVSTGADKTIRFWCDSNN